MFFNGSNKELISILRKELQFSNNRKQHSSKIGKILFSNSTSWCRSLRREISNSNRFLDTIVNWIIHSNWKVEPKCPAAGELTNKMWYILLEWNITQSEKGM